MVWHHLLKMEQQRTRRCKRYINEKINNTISKKNKINNVWSTTNITPGTNFMNQLSLKIKKHLSIWNSIMASII